MVRLREIPRTATFAWSPYPSSSPLIATGTRSGAVDASFSSETTLEIWDLGLDAADKKGETELGTPVARLTTDSGFNDIAWAESEDSAKGIIAGALENGALDIWNVDKLLAGESDALISRVNHHSGPIKALQFNPKHQNLLATAGAKGELYVSDLNNEDSAFRLGNRVARSDDIECLDWNRRVPHILVTGSSGGFVTVWDVKTKKETLTLSNLNRRPVSAIAWDPERPTKLITGTPLESDPIICLWDLRNSNAPERVLRGHENGVLDLAWCVQDPRLLISCGMDDRTLAWNPETGEKYGEYPIVTNWTFQTRFNPHNPNIFATASFDGKIAVQTLQNTSTTAAQDVALGAAEHTDGEDFFNKAQSQPQVSTFSLPKAPRWFERPVGATFGFGGKVISIGLVKGTRSSQIKITPFEVDAGITAATESFEKALDQGDLRSICESRIQSAATEEEKADWKVIETLISENPKKQLVEYLGLSDQVDETADSLGKLGLGPSAPSSGAATGSEPGTPGTPSLKPSGGKKHKRIQSIFEPSPESAHFLSDLSLTKSAKSNDPFHIFSGEESEADRAITRALMLGHFETALDVALKEDRMSDAFCIAICGGDKCVRKAQEYYFTRPKEENGPSYERLLASIAGKNLWDVVHNADLTNWKEAIATICTYAEDAEFNDLCEVLGDRLEDYSRQDDGKNKGFRKDASFCYLISSKLEKVVALWIEELREVEQSKVMSESATSGASAFSIHAHALQDLIEKVTVFRQVTKFVDEDQDKQEWKLAMLYDRYIEYAEIMSSHGCMDVAKRYLDLLPSSHPVAKVAKDRIQLATKPAAATAPAATAPAARVPAAGGRTTPVARAGSLQTPQRMARVPVPAQSNPYAPQSSYMPTAAPTAPAAASPVMTPAAPVNPYAPAGVTATPRNPYAPPTATAQAATPVSAPTNPYAPAAAQIPANPYAPQSAAGYTPPGAQRAGGVPPPPRQFGSASSAASGVPPPPQGAAAGQSYANATNLPAWNDIPDDFTKKQAAMRRATPSASAVPTPFPGAPQMPGMAPNPIVKPPSRGPAAVPPPPKGPAPPPRLSSPPNVSGPRVHPAPPVIGMATTPQRPPSNPYAPAPPPQAASPAAAAYTPQPTIPRGPSPYNAPPPAAAPPVNRYAPSPAQPPAVGSPQMMARGPSPYAPVAASSPYAPTGPAPVSVPVPGRAESPAVHGQGISRPPTSQSSLKVSQTPPKHPAGDRTHIPAAAQPIYEILSADMQRVKARAPSSFKAQVNDTERRLNILFDHLNNEDLLKADTINSMVELAQAVQGRDYDTAHAIHLEIMTNRMDECGNWMVGVKRLIGMSRATP